MLRVRSAPLGSDVAQREVRDVVASPTETLWEFCVRCGPPRVLGMCFLVTHAGRTWNSADHAAMELRQLGLASGDGIMIDADWLDHLRTLRAPDTGDSTRPLRTVSDGYLLESVQGETGLASRSQSIMHWDDDAPDELRLSHVGVEERCISPPRPTRSVLGASRTPPRTRPKSPPRSPQRLLSRSASMSGSARAPKRPEDPSLDAARLLLRISDALARRGSSPKQLFQRLDSRLTGRLTRCQLQQMLLAFEPGLAPEVLPLLFATFDHDCSGDVSLRDFCNALGTAQNWPPLRAR